MSFKIRIGVLLLLVTIPATVVSKSGSKVTSRYDPFADRTTIATDEIPISSGRLSMIVSFGFPGKAPVRPQTIKVLFISFSDNWLFDRPSSVIALVGTNERVDSRLQLGETERQTAKVITGRTRVSVREAVTLDVPLETFTVLANAERAQIRLRPGLEFEFKDSDLKALKELLSQLPR